MRLPPQLHAALKRRAREEGVSLNALCVAALKAYVGTSAPGSKDTAPVPLDRIKSVLGPSLSGVLLFGSAARGEMREGSDIDLLIVLSPEVPLTRSLYERWEQDIGLPAASRISPHFVHLPSSEEKAGSLWYEAAVDATTLFDREGLLSRFLRGIRRFMAEGKVQRKSAYGHPYWVKRGGEVPRVQ